MGAHQFNFKSRVVGSTMKSALVLLVGISVAFGSTEADRFNLTSNNNNNNNNGNNNNGFNGKEYHIIDTQTLSWSQAKQRCQQLGWELATVESQGENFYLLGKLVYEN